jgi:hypothetical protein
MNGLHDFEDGFAFARAAAAFDTRYFSIRHAADG